MIDIYANYCSRCVFVNRDEQKESDKNQPQKKTDLQFPLLSSMSKMMFVWPVSTSHSWFLAQVPIVALHNSILSDTNQANKWIYREKKSCKRNEMYKENIQFAFLFSPKLMDIQNSQPLNYLYRQFIAIFIFEKIENLLMSLQCTQHALSKRARFIVIQQKQQKID